MHLMFISRGQCCLNSGDASLRGSSRNAPHRRRRQAVSPLGQSGKWSVSFTCFAGAVLLVRELDARNATCRGVMGGSWLWILTSCCCCSPPPLSLPLHSLAASFFTRGSCDPVRPPPRCSRRPAGESFEGLTHHRRRCRADAEQRVWVVSMSPHSWRSEGKWNCCPPPPPS